MLDSRTLTHAQLLTIVADVQAILWQESHMRPDFLAAANCMITTVSGVRFVASDTTGRIPKVYAGLKGHGAEGVVLKRRKGLYAKHIRPAVESRDWLKRRFTWD